MCIFSNAKHNIINKQNPTPFITATFCCLKLQCYSAMQQTCMKQSKSIVEFIHKKRRVTRKTCLQVFITILTRTLHKNPIYYADEFIISLEQNSNLGTIRLLYTIITHQLSYLCISRLQPHKNTKNLYLYLIKHVIVRKHRDYKPNQNTTVITHQLSYVCNSRLQPYKNTKTNYLYLIKHVIVQKHDKPNNRS
eukprot:TRINITY_DN8974_c0_g1_i4.p1 TRINITY_DN8974_c0_g1~~TRINITY_DN8974_c0_g1_i4.p1  ORF type:complete len:193 (+),score=-20.97 TRINITY_DN8974_c0_g1_i4:808-1386(+)